MKQNQATIISDQMRHTSGPGAAQLVHTIGSLTDSLSNIKDLAGDNPPQRQAIDDLRHSIRDAIAAAAAAISASPGGKALTDEQIATLTGL